MSDSLRTMITSGCFCRDHVALFRREGFAFAELALGVPHLCLCEVVCQNVLIQCSVGGTAFNMLCSSAVNMLCSNAVRLGVPCGSAVCFDSGNSTAPVGETLLFRQTHFVARHDIPHVLVQ